MPRPTDRTDPTDPLLRREVGLLRARESRRVFDTMVHLGRLAGPRTSLVVAGRDLPVLDLGLRTDLVGRLLDSDGGTGTAEVWLSRAGTTDLQDRDLGWLAAASAACMERDRVLGAFYVVTRSGWLDPRTGRSRTWKRLRL